MSAAVKPKPVAASAAPAAPGRLEATVQILDFEAGFYSVEVLAAGTTRVREGLSLPCIRLEPIPPANGTGGRAHVASLSDSGLIASGQHPAYLRAEGGMASVMLTIYKIAGATTSPELRIRSIDPVLLAAPPVPAVPALPSLPLTLLAHVERSGDITVGGGAWVGQPGSGTIEGFQLLPGGDLTPADIEYQAVLGKDWSTPWMSGGEFCGSRGLALPLLGVRIRLVGAAAKRYSCSYWGAFNGQGELGPMSNGAACAADGSVLEALRVVLSLRAADTARPSPAGNKTRAKDPAPQKPAPQKAAQPKILPKPPPRKMLPAAKRRRQAPPPKPGKRR